VGASWPLLQPPPQQNSGSSDGSSKLGQVFRFI